ncbi:hypothetical protein LPB137_02605 [Poseidonibacter parvus]|uniref:Uncharacterized protein n=1 Tax=Poseidonibacter parvus TaxID=1850254 RepID=A0A1P8KJW0_9BACT|nr:hypothetical protein [Poseidonibacter parvus]APW64814.1 hypothetical protein LPB137_02605 [Poseidonibacter parvus]
MKILLIILILLIIFFVVKYLVNKKRNLIEDIETEYSIESISILKKYFGAKNFFQNKDLKDLKNKLAIKSDYKNELSEIIETSIHKINIQYEHNINSNKPYTNLNSLKTCGNEVIDYCINEKISIKKAIVLLLLTINTEEIKDIVNEDIEDEEIIEDFYSFLPTFIEKYNLKNAN